MASNCFEHNGCGRVALIQIGHFQSYQRHQTSIHHQMLGTVFRLLRVFSPARAKVMIVELRSIAIGCVSPPMSKQIREEAQATKVVSFLTI